MKKIKTIACIDKFTDYKGVSRMFVVAGVILRDRECEEYAQFGIAVAHPSDVDRMNEELGITIAEGKATCDRTCIGTLYVDGLIPLRSTVELVVNQEVAHFKRNPGYFIKGYNEMKDNYIAKANKDLDIDLED